MVSCWALEAVNGGESLCVELFAAIFVRFPYSMAKPCTYIIIDDSDTEKIASEQSPAQPCFYNLGRWSLGRAVAPSHCQPMDPTCSSPEDDP